MLHAIRREMATVVKTDHGGIRVQYQGDRVPGIFHMPKDDSGERIATDGGGGGDQLTIVDGKDAKAETARGRRFAFGSWC